MSKEISETSSNIRRKVIVEVASPFKNISQESVDFIRMVEKAAYPKEMLTLQWCETPSQMAYANMSKEKDLICGRGEDWYCLLSQSNKILWICDIAALPTRNILESRKEMAAFFDEYVINLAVELRSTVLIEAREETSYKMILRMVNQGKFQILEDKINLWTGTDIKMHFMELKPIAQTINTDNNIYFYNDNIKER